MDGAVTRPTVPREARDTVNHAPLAAAQALLLELLNSSLVMAEDLERLPTCVQEELSQCDECDDLLPRLVAHGLLTAYQAGRIGGGGTSGLIVGHYRILDKIGVGGMGVVYRAEHLDLRRQVAVKVLSPSDGPDAQLQQRFLAEMRAVARLQHPNIVAAVDAGKWPGPDPGSPRSATS